MKSPSFALLALCLLSIGCKKNEEVVSATTVTPVVSVSVSNLPRLTADEGHYQVWATFTIFAKHDGSNSPQHDSGFVSLGEFTIGADGHSLIDPDSGGPAHFSVPTGQDPQLLNDVIIAIQTPEVGLAKLHHEEPGSAIIGARFVGTQSLAVADLDITYQDAFGTDFSTVTGKYTITAPTSVASDSNSGVWFYEPLSAPTASLRQLANLGEHWRYEGWVVDKADTLDIQYFSTGRFSRADSADYDGAGSGKGPGVGLNFPGQDFITGTPLLPNLLNSQYAFRVTIEPEPDNSPEPFFLTLLSSDVPALSARPMTNTFAMQNMISQHRPTAHITVER